MYVSSEIFQIFLKEAMHQEIQAAELKTGRSTMVEYHSQEQPSSWTSERPVLAVT